MEFDPRRVLFAHDGAVWEPSADLQTERRADHERMRSS